MISKGINPFKVFTKFLIPLVLVAQLFVYKDKEEGA